MLGRGVRADQRHAGEPGVRGGVDDRPAARGHDLGGDGTHPEERAGQIDPDHLLELRERGVQQLVEAQDARVVDEPVDLPEGALGGGHGGGPVRLTAHVEPDGQGGVRAQLLVQLLCQRRRLVVQHVGDDDPRPFPREEPRLLLALPARRPGDEDDPPVQLAHVLLLHWSRGTGPAPVGGGAIGGRGRRDPRPSQAGAIGGRARHRPGPSGAEPVTGRGHRSPRPIGTRAHRDRGLTHRAAGPRPHRTRPSGR